jgi:hypothetical protein
MSARASILAVGEEPLPIDEDSPEEHQVAVSGRTPAREKRALTQGKSKDRFQTLNLFLDVTASGLSRNELLIWLLLYRDTRDGIARTGQADLARRGGHQREDCSPQSCSPPAKGIGRGRPSRASGGRAIGVQNPADWRGHP